MASLACDARQASHALLQMSWEQDVPVRDVAAALVAAVQSPESPARATELAASDLGGAARESPVFVAPHGTDLL